MRVVGPPRVRRAQVQLDDDLGRLRPPPPASQRKGLEVQLASAHLAASNSLAAQRRQGEALETTQTIQKALLAEHVEAKRSKELLQKAFQSQTLLNVGKQVTDCLTVFPRNKNNISV